MLIYIIYIIVTIILVTVLVIAVKAINRGIEAKRNLKEENNIEKIEDEKINYDSNKNNSKLLNEINNLKKLHSEGVLSDEEFKKAKEKILF